MFPSIGASFGKEAGEEGESEWGLLLCWECLAGSTGSRRDGEGAAALTNAVALVARGA